jgi:DNA topoisomerase-1
VIDAYLDGTLATTLKKRVEKHLAKHLKGLRPEEAAVLALLQTRLAGEEQRLSRQLEASLRHRIKHTLDRN